MVRAGVAVLALVGLAIGMDCRAESAFINLRPEVEVDRREVRLADIAEIATRKPSNAVQLGETVVAKCRSLVLPCHIAKADILSILQGQATELGATLVWGANEQVTVRGRMRPLSLAPAIERAAIRILQQMDRGFPITVGIKEGLDSIEVPPGTAELRPDFDQMRWSGTSIELPINVLVDGINVTKPVIRYSLQRGPATTDPEMMLTAAKGRPDDGLTTIRRPLSTGALGIQSVNQSREALKADAVVAKNKKVRILIDSGPLRVEAEGIALADAELGGTVQVRRPNGLADVRGRAISRGTVLIEED